MATSPIPLWAQEISPYHRGPTGAGVLALAAVGVRLGLALSAKAPASIASRTGLRGPRLLVHPL
jgi:hypothetical protein